METRTEGPYDFEPVSEKLRKRERPSTSGKGNGPHRLHGMRRSMFTCFQDEDVIPEDGGPPGDARWIFMRQLLFTLPEVYEDDIWKDVVQHVDGDDAVFAA